MAQILPPPPKRTPHTGFEAMKGTIEILGDIVGPTGDIDDWEAARGEE